MRPVLHRLAVVPPPCLLSSMDTAMLAVSIFVFSCIYGILSILGIVGLISIVRIVISVLLLVVLLYKFEIAAVQKPNGGPLSKARSNRKKRFCQTAEPFCYIFSMYFTLNPFG